MNWTQVGLDWIWILPSLFEIIIIFNRILQLWVDLEQLAADYKVWSNLLLLSFQSINLNTIVKFLVEKPTKIPKMGSVRNQLIAL